MAKEQFIADVFIIIRNEEGKILLQRRQGTKLCSGFLALPAGHVDEGENVYEAVVREAKEELGITINPNDIIDTFVINRKNKSLPSYFDVFFEFSRYEGNIKIMEPQKCSELTWCDPSFLPEDMIGFEKEALLNNIKGIKFSVIYVDNEKEFIKTNK